MAIESADNIRRRMIQNASRAWGYPDTQDINSFDPIVGMLMGALADELNNISGEIQNTDSRIIQKLLDLLFNQSHLSHFPAYGILQASPTMPVLDISDNYQFYYRKRIESTQSQRGKAEEKSIHFTPSGDFRLFKANTSIMACGDQLFLLSGQVKEGIDLSGINFYPDFTKLFIGIDLDRNIEDLQGLSLHFTLKNRPLEDRFYKLLESGKWSVNRWPVHFSQGLGGALKVKTGSLEELYQQESDVSYRACKFVNELFGRQFMVLEDKLDREVFLNGKMPEELRHQYTDDILSSIPDNLCWIEVELNQAPGSEIISELLPSVNCFPVINRARNEFTQSLRKGTNIIPLKSEDNYFDIKQVTDSRGREYTLANDIGNGASQKRSYIIRHGGMARFDSRDALETIDHLTDLVRNESAAFSILGTDMISSELKELDQIISRLRHRLETSSASTSATSYAVLNSLTGNERIHVEFWTSSGELANNIRIGSKLNVHRGRDVNMNSVFMITTTKGGKQKLSQEEKLNKIKTILLSKGRIVTREDIKALCHEHFGKDLQTVEIANGIQTAEGPKSGLIQTLDINVNLKKQHKLSPEDLIQKEDELKIMLKQASVNMISYRIFIKS